MLAAPGPLLHLFVKMLRHEDPRAGRSFWTGIALCGATSVITVFINININAYAAAIHGF